MLSKMTKIVKEEANDKLTKRVTNFMGGNSYELSPLETLKMVTASSIFGEPQYYRDGEFAEKGVKDGFYKVDSLFSDYSVLDKKYEGKKTSDIMENIIDDALDYDFGETLQWAITLRKDYLMRLNPQIIMVRASIHPQKSEFIAENPGLFDKINQVVMSRADEPASQLTYYLYKNKSHKNLPNILKRSWAKKIESLKPYAFNKYKNSGVGMKDLICLCHPKSELVDEYMKTGKVKVAEEDKTWETLKSAGKSWKEILQTIKLPHMALLKNLRNIFTEIEDVELCKNLMQELKDGVLTGKQFPFRYWSALNAIETERVNHKTLIMDALEECIDIARGNMPKLKGKTMCLSDNSGSAWGAFTSEYGSVTIAEIGNLSSVITAQNSDEGYVGKFGDRLKEFAISKRNGALIQTKNITNKRYDDVGGRTENGIWLFFDRAIKNKEHWDNIFVYSDQQAGHGGLYGVNPYDYSKYSCINGRYIDVNKLIKEYRSKVNPKVNVFMVQTAGYNNVLVPEYGYRTNILYGWTGKELVFANAMNEFWDKKDAEKISKQGNDNVVANTTSQN